jgi:Kef-type K+ transport system membrane component KefB
MDSANIPVLLLIGGAILAGVVGGRLFQWLKIPQVVGYIAIGVLLGKSGFQVIADDEIAGLRVFNFFALGIIGFLVGGELKIDAFRKYFRQYVAILIGEGVAAFLLVGISTGLAAYVVSHSAAVAVAAGIVLGSIASATDPASTIDVLWEYRARGVLTATIIAIVALDDALAMTLYGIGTGVAQIVTSHSGSVGAELISISIELLGAVALGWGAGLAIKFLSHWMKQPEQMLPLALGLVMLVIGVCVRFDMDVIMGAMAMGFTLVNVAPYRTQWLFKTMRTFAVPIYVLFFVLIGARLYIAHIPFWLWLVIAFYVIGRSAGKVGGSFLGARMTGGAKSVQKYLGMALFAQGGVAVGLSIMASTRLQSIVIDSNGFTLADMIISCVTATTLIVQLMGPPSVKIAITKAGERGLNVTEEDLLQSYRVGDVMDTKVPSFAARSPVAEVFRQIVDSSAMTFCVTEPDGKILGILTMSELKRCLADTEMANWLVAYDIMLPTPDKLTPDMPLPEAMHQMRETGLEYLPVIDSASEKYIGMIEMQAVTRQVTQEVLRRRRVADGGADL